MISSIASIALLSMIHFMETGKEMICSSINKSDRWTIEVLKQRIPGELQRIGREEELGEIWSNKNPGSFYEGHRKYKVCLAVLR